MSQSRRFLPFAEAQAPFYVGIDLGGTNIKAGIVDDLGRPLAWLQVPTETEQGPEEGAKRMGAMVGQLLAQAGMPDGSIARVGLGSPGTMDIPAGRLLEPHNLPGWFDFNIRERVSHHSGLPVTFANDANAAAYAEYWVGSGREFHSLVLFTLGTGVGCGIIIGDLSVDGENSHGGECGHIIIDYQADARRCSCGQTGHLEAYASATAVIQRAEEALEAGPDTSVTAALAAGEELTPLLLAEHAEQGDPFSLDIIMDTARYVGVGAVTLMHTIDPHCVVLGGAMNFGGHASPLGRRFLARVQEEINQRAFPVLAKRVKIDFASLGGDAGYIGAAGLARLEHRKAANYE